MTLMCQIQASGHVSEGEHLKLFKDADADIGSLLAAAPPQGLAGPRGYDHAIFDPLSLHPFGSQPWIMVGPAPPFPPASTAALQTSMLMDEAHPASSSLFMPSNHLMIANPLPIPSSGDLVCSEGGQAAIGVPWMPEAPGNPHVPAHGDDATAYQDMTTAQLLEVYEQQQEELVKLSKELEDYTRKNIQLSTRNLEHLQQLQGTNSPIMSQAIVQPPRLSQLATRVRRQAQEHPTEVGDRPGDGGAAVGAADEMQQPHSRASTEDGSREGGAEEIRLPRPRGVVTQEQAAAILMQMSQRMADAGAVRPP